MNESPSLRFAHYEVRRREDGTPWELGRGAMGVTYKAYDSQLRLDVALKVINPSQMGDSKAQALFLREARAAARVHQSNVASVIYLNQDPANPFYAMEFIAGESLHDWLGPRRPLPLLLAIRLAEQIALGLEAIHAEQFVHRDLKPGNLMIVRTARGREPGASETNAETWQAKIIDFGLVRALSGSETNSDLSAVTTGFRGTAVYASPEQCQEQTDLDGRSDLYSLGCILWEMLTGLPPFRGKTLHELLTLHITRPAPLEQVAHLPPCLQAILARLLAKEPDGRFADATALGHALAQCRERIVSGDEKSQPTAMAVVAAPLSVAATLIAETQPATRTVAIAAASATGMLPASAVTVAAGSAGTPSAGPRRRWLAVAGAVVALLAIGLVVGKGRGWFKPPVPNAPIIAVLPFDATGSSKEDEQLADLLTTELINRLSQIPTLRVISRGAVAGYRIAPGSSSRRIRDLGRELGGVRAVLEGSVRRIGDKLKIDAVLFDAESEKGLWSETYDREGKDIFAIQAEVAEQIAGALKSRIATAERQRFQATTPDNLTAYDLYLRAIKLDKANPEQRILLERAVELDPKFAEAFMSLAENHWKAYARKLAAGQQLENVDEFDKAVSLARQAVALDPECINCLVELSALINRQGKIDEGHELVRRALKLSPNSPDANETAGYQARLEGRYDEGYAYTRRVSMLWPNDPGIVRELLRISTELNVPELINRWTARAIELATDPREKQRLEINRMETLGDFAAAAEQRRLQPAAEDDNVFLLARQHDWNAVMAATDPPLRKELKNLGAGVVRAYALSALGKIEAACEAATSSLEEDRKYFDTAKARGLRERALFWRMAVALQILARDAEAAAQLELWDKSNMAAAVYYRLAPWWQPIFQQNPAAQTIMERMRKRYEVMAKRVVEIEKSFDTAPARKGVPPRISSP